jgi:hypothetical protein
MTEIVESDPGKRLPLCAPFLGFHESFSRVHRAGPRCGEGNTQAQSGARRRRVFPQLRAELWVELHGPAFPIL